MRPARDDLTRAEILALLGSNGPTSRAEIATRLGIAGATVTAHARRLLSEGFIREEAARTAGTGRPRVPLGLVADAAHVLGLRVTSDRVLGVVVGLDGCVVDEFAVTVDIRTDPIGQLTAIVVDQLEVHHDLTFLGVGVAVPGVVEPGSGMVRLSGTMCWKDVPLGSELGDRVPVPVLIDNDLHASTTAELLFGLGRDHDDFLVLGLDKGIGLGIVLNRQVHRGPEGTAGEFGHIPVEPENGPSCTCGARGCLRTFASEVAIVQAARERGVIRPDEGVHSLVGAIEQSEPAAIRMMEQIGRMLGYRIAGVVNVLAVRAITVTGGLTVLWPYLAPPFTASVRASILPPMRALETTMTPWRETAHARGAACLLLASGGMLSRRTTEPAT